MNPGGSKTVPPEETLLRLIRGKPAAAAAAGPSALAAVAGVPSLGAPGWLLTLLNGLLGLVLAGEVVALAWLLSASAPAVKIPEPPPVGATYQAPAPPTLPQLASAVQRPIFQVREAKPVEPVTDPGKPRTKPTSEAIRSLASRLKLIGVVAGDPAQAIIEDSKDQKTHFLGVGQALPDGAIVQKILENRVVLELDGETIELSL